MDPPTTCPTCGEQIVVGDRFCEACGADLPAATTEPSPAGGVTIEVDVTPQLKSHQMAFPGEAASSATAPDEGVAIAAPPHRVTADIPDPTAGLPVAPVAAPPVPSPATPLEPGEPCLQCEEGTVRDGWCDSCGTKAPDPRDRRELDLGVLAGVSDIGQRYRRNEDSMAMAVGPDGTIAAVVCDGVGSTVDPHLASQGAADAAVPVLVADPSAMRAAHAAARQAAADVPAAQEVAVDPPSATFLAATISNGLLRLGTLGDCRAYLLPPDGDAAVISRDDSMEHELVAAGLDPETAKTHPQANVITRWLGRDADPSWEPRVSEHPVRPGSRVVLCSDGLWRYVESAAHMAELVGDAQPPLATAQRLVAHANDSGGADNITAVVIDVAAPAPEEGE